MTGFELYGGVDDSGHPGRRQNPRRVGSGLKNGRGAWCQFQARGNGAGRIKTEKTVLLDHHVRIVQVAPNP